jgi:pilus assembly protein CpaB
MNRNRLLLIGVVALVLAAFVSYLVYLNLQSRTSGNMPPGVPVVVAANDIPLGARLEEKDLRLARIQQDDVPVGSFHDKSQIAGRGVVVPIAKGDFILRSKVAGENAGSGLPSLIPPGMRAVSVRVNEVVGVAGFVQPGTRVDVLVTGSPLGGGEEQTTTVLKNVAVIAAGQKLERNYSGEALVSPVITLVLSPDDAQRLTLASNQGRIQLVLRNPLDTGQETVAATSAGSLFGRAVPVPTPHVAVKHTAVHVQPPPEPYSVEVYRGDKKDITKFQGQD